MWSCSPTLPHLRSSSSCFRVFMTHLLNQEVKHYHCSVVLSVKLNVDKINSIFYHLFLSHSHSLRRTVAKIYNMKKMT